MIEPFEIITSSFLDKKKFKLQVEVTHESDQVIRFLITAPGYEVKMEKLLKERQQWKIREANFNLLDAAVLEDMREIQNRIDHHFAPPRVRRGNWKSW